MKKMCTVVKGNFSVTIDENGKARIAKGPSKKQSVSANIRQRKSRKIKVKK